MWSRVKCAPRQHESEMRNMQMHSARPKTSPGSGRIHDKTTRIKIRPVIAVLLFLSSLLPLLACGANASSSRSASPYPESRQQQNAFARVPLARRLHCKHFPLQLPVASQTAPSPATATHRVSLPRFAGPKSARWVAIGIIHQKSRITLKTWPAAIVDPCVIMPPRPAFDLRQIRLADTLPVPCGRPEPSPAASSAGPSRAATLPPLTQVIEFSLPVSYFVSQYLLQFVMYCKALNSPCFQQPGGRLIAASSIRSRRMEVTAPPPGGYIPAKFCPRR